MNESAVKTFSADYQTALYGLIKNPHPGIEEKFYQVHKWLIVLPKKWGIQLKVNGQKDLELRSEPTYMEVRHKNTYLCCISAQTLVVAVAV